MKANSLRWFMAAVLLLSGCAGIAEHRKVAWEQEGMCKHCNCLMPAGIDPEAKCPVCKCGYPAHQCRR